MDTEKKQLELDKRYIRMASIWAENSYCQRRKVGALIVKDKMIISDGYNGTPSGFENVCEDENNLTKPYVLHAEANAITKIARSNNSSDGATMYVTASPCIECAKLIIQAGIKRVVYSEHYRLEDENNLTKPYVLHAEANAITKIARSNNSSDGATMYVTASPCIECAKLIIQAGIKRVVYSEHYRLEDGIELLKRAGIEVIYTELDDNSSPNK